MIGSLAVRVPDGFLDLPSSRDRRRILRFEAALALDVPLRRLARVSGAVDRALARRLGRLHASRGYVKLGYALLGDYARERLGLAERTALDLARLGRALERLPLLDRALAEGRVTWTAAHQVARVAGVEDEAEWVSRAESHSVRELKRQVREARTDRESIHASGRPADSTGERRAPSGDGGDEPLGRMWIRAGARTAFYWYAALDLCREVAGFEGSDTEMAEYVLADFLSGGAALPGDLPPCVPARPPVDYPRGFRGRRSRFLDAGYPVASSIADELGASALDAESSRDLAEMLRGIERGEENDPFELDASMRRVIAARAGLDLDLARLLRNFQSLNLAGRLGYERLEDYVEARLGLSVRRARFLVQLDRRLFHCSAVARAVRSGRIGTVAALLLTRVAIPESTEQIWIDRAERVTVRRLRNEVVWAERRARLSGFRKPALPPPGGRALNALDELTAELQKGRPEFAVAEPASRDGEETEPWQTFADEGPQVDVVFHVPASVVELWTEARRQIAFVTGEPFVPDRVVLHWIAVDFLGTHLPSWLEALAREDPVAARERFRCAIPGCSVRGGSAHHVIRRSQGGPDEEWNESFICYTHHIEGIHRGRLRVTGKAPDRLTVELGIRPDGSALESFVDGERARPSARSDPRDNR